MSIINRKRQHALISEEHTDPNASLTTEPSTSKVSSSRTSSERVNSISVQEPAKERSQTQDAKKQQQLENVYAQELFFHHTDITQVLARLLPERNETFRQAFAVHLYRNYLLVPKQRIRKYLDEVRFDSRYNEGLFRMAFTVPITSAQELTLYKQKLAQAGIKKLCFVDMTVNNLVLEHQEKIIATLKERFNNWSGKLDKLSSYITMYQRQRETDDREFRSQLKRHSSMKGCWSLRLSGVVEELVRESRMPSEKRKSLYWSTLRFDDDALNEKYETGDYCRSQNDMEIKPEAFIEYCPQRSVILTPEETRVDALETQLDDNYIALQENKVRLIDEKGQWTQQLLDQPHMITINHPKRIPRPKRIVYESDTFFDEALNNCIPPEIINIDSNSPESEFGTAMVTDEEEEEIYFSCSEGN